MRVRIARDELRRIRELTQTIKELEAEIADLVAQIAPHLLIEPGFGPLIAARLVGEIAAQPYIARKRAEGKSPKDAIRCLKRHLTHRIWHLLQPVAPVPNQTLTPSIS